jgi:hypothetical protein
MDVKGMINIKKKYITSIKENERKLCLKFHLEDREGAEQGVLLWCQSNDVLFLKLLSTFPL